MKEIIKLIKTSGRALGIFLFLKLILISFVLILVTLIITIFWISWWLGLLIILVLIIFIIILIFKIKNIILDFLSLEGAGENLEKIYGEMRIVR